MFKLKPGNVIEKINGMSRKQAYTYGGIGVGVLVALILLASFLGNAEDSSFEDFNARAYDLANSPFVTDEAEEFLLASVYPDMQGNNANALYGPSERAEREAKDELDAQEEEENADDFSSDEDFSDEDGDSDSSYGGGYGGSRSPTEIGQLGPASMGQADGFGVDTSWGSPRLDTTAYKSTEREKDPINTTNGRKADARRSLAQFAHVSRAGAQLKQGKAVNMKQALMGGELVGGATNSDGTLDLSKVEGTNLDTNAPEPTASSDLKDLSDALNRAAEDAKKKNENTTTEELSFLEKLAQKAIERGIDALLSSGGKFLEKQANSWAADMDETRDRNRQNRHFWKGPADKDTMEQVYGVKIDQNTWDNSCAGGTVKSCSRALRGLGGNYSNLPNTKYGSRDYYNAWHNKNNGKK